jgi:hypothetical protein
MTNQDMEQIRELLIGDFIKETQHRLESIEREISQIQEDNLQQIKNLSKSLTTKINQAHKMSQNNYQNLEDLVNKKFKEQKEITDSQLDSVINEIDTEKNFTRKSLNIVKKSMNNSLKSLREDMNDRHISKETLSTIFFDYSLRLKESSVEDTLIEKIANDNK